MIRALSQYAREEVIIRLVRVLSGTETLIAGVVGVAIGIFGPGSDFASLKPSDISTALLTYAAIAFGFCISGMALVLTLPNQDFVTWLIKEPIRNRSTSAYSDLLFVFSWTAVCHWVVVLLAFAALIVGNSRSNLLNWYDGKGWRIFIGILFGVAVYGFIQFLLTVITLSQVGRLYIGKIEREAKNTGRTE